MRSNYLDVSTTPPPFIRSYPIRDRSHRIHPHTFSPPLSHTICLALTRPPYLPRSCLVLRLSWAPWITPLPAVGLERVALRIGLVATIWRATLSAISRGHAMVARTLTLNAGALPNAAGTVTFGATGSELVRDAAVVARDRTKNVRARMSVAKDWDANA